MINITKKGCWTTCFNYALLIYGLEPRFQSKDEGDPMGILLILPYFAIKSNNHQWCLNYWNQYKHQLKDYACWSYTVALAQYSADDADKKRSSILLQRAIIYFPGVVLGLFDKCGASDASVTGCSYFKW